MELMPGIAVNEAALKHIVVELKLAVNRRLFEKGAITEEMYFKARELIVKST